MTITLRIIVQFISRIYVRFTSFIVRNECKLICRDVLRLRKCLSFISVLAGALFFTSCGGERARRPEGQGGSAHAALAGIDSLMWRRADSAFAVLQECVVYCKTEPISSQDISNVYTRIEVQHDKQGNKNKMRDSNEQAIKKMLNTDNLGYRDLVVSKALGEYQLGLRAECSLNAIRQILAKADDDEKSSRYLVIGAIFAEEKMYDSALFYLEPIFEIRWNI